MVRGRDTRALVVASVVWLGEVLPAVAFINAMPGGMTGLARRSMISSTNPRHAASTSGMALQMQQQRPAVIGDKNEDDMKAFLRKASLERTVALPGPVDGHAAKTWRVKDKGKGAAPLEAASAFPAVEAVPAEDFNDGLFWMRAVVLLCAALYGAALPLRDSPGCARAQVCAAFGAPEARPSTLAHVRRDKFRFRQDSAADSGCARRCSCALW